MLVFYEEQPPVSGWTIDPLVDALLRDNFEEISNYMWSELQNTTIPNQPTEEPTTKSTAYSSEETSENIEDPTTTSATDNTDETSENIEEPTQDNTEANSEDSNTNPTEKTSEIDTSPTLVTKLLPLSLILLI